MNGTAVVLNRRHRQMLYEICLGAGTKDLAAAFDISHSTARAHVRSLCTATGVGNLTQLVVYGHQQPWVMRKQRQGVKGIHRACTTCPCPHCVAMLSAAAA